MFNNFNYNQPFVKTKFKGLNQLLSTKITEKLQKDVSK